ncbi:hypothetical protein X975_00368, partial [Stegodyphus mimosarum]
MSIKWFKCWVLLTFADTVPTILLLECLFSFKIQSYTLIVPGLNSQLRIYNNSKDLSVRKFNNLSLKLKYLCKS